MGLYQKWASQHGCVDHPRQHKYLVTIFSTLLFWHGPCYFEANVMLLAFIGLGKYLETQVKHKSLSNIQSLVALLPSEVKTYRNGKWQLLKRQ